MIQPTKWQFSEMVAKTDTPLSAGWHVLRIESAKMVSEETSDYYSVTLRDIESPEQCTVFRYYLLKKDGTRNESAIGTLNKLGYCIYGVVAGIPNPVDIVNGIVKGDVKLTPNEEKGTVFRSIYDFQPIDALTLRIASEVGTTIDQYIEDSED